MDKKLSTILVGATSTLLLMSGCGGSSSSSSKKTAEPQAISGIVTDPAIVGANVKLVCDEESFYANDLTTEEGLFNIENIPASTDLQTCILEAKGGKDGADDLTGLVLKAPYKLFNNPEGVYITPFTHIVAEHDSDDINTSLDAVAEFFGVEPQELLKDPASDIKLARITKSITKAALTKNDLGNLSGYIDIDSGINGENFDEYVENDLDVTQEEKEKLGEELKAIKDSQNVSEIIQNGIIGNIVYRLKKAYQKDTYTEAELENFHYLATVLTDELKTVDGTSTTYNPITSYQLRKALTDLSMTPSFNEDFSLVDEINDVITSDESTFTTYVDDKNISIQDIDGIVLFDTQKYESILGDNNDKRIEYYAFSDKSHIASILSFEKNSYTDDVLDVIHTKAAEGLSKLGFYDDALEHLHDNVYTTTLKEDAYKDLGLLLISLGVNEKAADAYYERYKLIQSQVESLGKEFTSNTHTSNLQSTATKLVKAQDTAKAAEVVNYLEELAPFLGTTSSYGRVVQAFEDMSENVYLETGNKELAKQYIINGVNSVQNIPTDKPKTAYFYTYRTALTASIFGAATEASQAEARALEIDPNGEITTYPYFPVALDALIATKDWATINANFDALSTTKKDDASQYGYAAGLLLSGQEDRLFNDIYTNETIYSPSNIDKIFAETKIGSSTTFYTAMILKIKGEDTILESYLDRLHTISEDYNSTYIGSDSDMLKIFAKWDDELKNRYGYLAMAQHYLDLGKNAKAQNLVDISLAKVQAFTDNGIKIEALINILNAATEMDLVTPTITTTIATEIKAAGLNEFFTDEEEILTAANLLSSHGYRDDAILLIDKVYNSLEAHVDADIGNIEDRAEILIGKKDRYDVYSANIANAYFQAGALQKAKDALTEANNNIMSLADTVDRYELLIGVVAAYASMNDIDSLIPILNNEIKTLSEQNEAKVDIVNALANYDAFTFQKAASVDLDADGKPDFWNKNATQDDITASGLTLDDDIDNDGILDTEDTLPFNAL